MLLVLAVGSGRGRFPPVRGGFRSDSFRGRRNFAGGRGYGRNEFGNRGDFSGRGRGPGGRSGEGYQQGRGRVGHRATRVSLFIPSLCSSSSAITTTDSGIVYQDCHKHTSAVYTLKVVHGDIAQHSPNPSRSLASLDSVSLLILDSQLDWDKLTKSLIFCQTEVLSHSRTLVPYPLIPDFDFFTDNLGLAEIISAS
ncbi:hypothetical protein TEA_024483 [Camellia sinensis var. sinensis]|uniref:Uncharacterized protein n=1 Tax=Camellia sinensis var. sinensis TaxID=542762 RepID=A0A4S4DNC6_CAMSN|nr:hypothetical protein TEA_024483 [Camellia sinensis var. sinensis]